MIKSTRAKLTLLFCINKKNQQLDTALEAIARQTDKDFELIVIFNGASNSEKDIYKKFNFKSINSVRNIFISENVGDSYALKYCYSFVNTDYIYYFDSNVILHPDFVSTVNKFISKHENVDVISFFGVPNIYFKEEYITIKTLADDFCYRPLVSYNNKILRLKYLIDNKIEQPMFKHWEVYFYVMLMKGNPKWLSIGRQICDISPRPYFPYNTLDLFEQCEEMVSLLDQKPFKDHYSEIEYLCVVTLLRNFLYAYFTVNKGRLFPQKRVINKVEEFINSNFPRWQENEFLNSDKNKNDVTYLEYIREFKPKLSYVYKAINSKEFLKGYGHKKH